LQVVFDSLDVCNVVLSIRGLDLTENTQSIDRSTVPLQLIGQHMTERRDTEQATPACEEPAAIPRSLLHAHSSRPPVESAHSPITPFHPLYYSHPHYALSSPPPIIWCECHPSSHTNPWAIPHSPLFDHPIRSPHIPYVTINTNVSDIGNNNSTTTTLADM